MVGAESYNIERKCSKNDNKLLYLEHIQYDIWIATSETFRNVIKELGHSIQHKDP